MKRRFLDTNVLIYANDARDRAKQEKALACVTEALREGTGVVSTQVLAEYARTALDKLGQAPEVVLRQLLVLESLEVIQVTPALVRRSVELHQVYQLNYWDAGVIAAAELAQCDVVLSEDFSDGRLYGAVRVENPFAVGG